jgi:hypothetical protein
MPEDHRALPGSCRADVCLAPVPPLPTSTSAFCTTSQMVMSKKRYVPRSLLPLGPLVTGELGAWMNQQRYFLCHHLGSRAWKGAHMHGQVSKGWSIKCILPKVKCKVSLLELHSRHKEVVIESVRVAKERAQGRPTPCTRACFGQHPAVVAPHCASQPTIPDCRAHPLQ